VRQVGKKHHDTVGLPHIGRGGRTLKIAWIYGTRQNEVVCAVCNFNVFKIESLLDVNAEI